MNKTNTPQTSPPSVKLDLDRYLEPLEHWDVPPNTKREFLEALHAILVSCVDLGFGLHPLQHTDAETSGQVIDLNALLEPGVVDSDIHPKADLRKTHALSAGVMFQGGE